jgi:Uma2 family endonuclease
MRMATLVRDPQPADFEALLERRRRLDEDRFDEVWQGVLHMNPAPAFEHQLISQQLAELLGPLARAAGLKPVVGGVNVGVSDNYRIPDASMHKPGTAGTFLASAVLGVEILSPNDETYAKLPFYADHGVQEMVIVDPATRSVEWLGLQSDGEYRAIERSSVIDCGPAAMAEQIDWPQ